jgi:hypothetical protein|tara:strand:+ start:63 stop:701 length:639 start_codon:yes stop_codon:yes gene_type:complete
MCFSAESSITAYILGSIASLYLLIKGDKYDKHIGLFSLTFVQVQLAEFLMWIDQDCNKGINHYATIFMHYILFLQPMSVIIGAILFKTTNISKELLYFLVLSIICIIINSSIVIYKKKELCSKSINNGHLEWSGIPKYNLFYNVCYLILMSLIWPFLKNKKGLFVFIFGIITLLFGLNNNYRFDFDQWESKWCFYSVLLPCLIIIYNKIKKL